MRIVTSIEQSRDTKSSHDLTLVEQKSVSIWGSHANVKIEMLSNNKSLTKKNSISKTVASFKNSIKTH